MGGIACIFHTDGRPAAAQTLAAMTGAMAYRGPDGIAHHVAGPVALGQCTMHTTAESRDAQLPLASADGARVIVFDGYLANYDELRAELRQHGAPLRNRSDAELVLHAYAIWGQDCPRHIDGEYAFIVWDGPAQAVFCARDHKGLRPLYYCLQQDRVVLASDIKAVLVALDRLPEPNAGLLGEILLESHYSENETVWRGVMRVPAAHAMWLGKGRQTASRYWFPVLDRQLPFRRDADYVDHYREVLREAVRQTARSHVPLGCDVSGGLDSSALFCVADQLQAEGQLPAPDLRGYALAGPGGTDADEVDYHRAVASHLGRPIAELPLFTPRLNWFDQFVQDNATSPPLPHLAMAIHLETATRADGCRVRLNGVGGDEWLGGSHFAYEEELRRFAPRQFAKLLLDDLAQVGFTDTLRLLWGCGVAPILPQRLRQAIDWARGRSTSANPSWELLARAMTADMDGRRKAYETSLPKHGLLRVKREKLGHPYYAAVHDDIALQMAHHQLEPRYPYLTRKFIEFSLATPDRLKHVKGVTKALHRRALSDLLPPVIAERQGKAEFSIAYAGLDGDLLAMAAKPLSPAFQNVADVTAAREAIARYCAAPIDMRFPGNVWGIYVVQVISCYHESTKG